MLNYLTTKRYGKIRLYIYIRMDKEIKSCQKAQLFGNRLDNKHCFERLRHFSLTLRRNLTSQN